MKRPVYSQEDRVKALAFLEVKEAVTRNVEVTAWVAAKRLADVREAEVLGERARRKSREHLADAEGRLDEAINEAIDTSGLRQDWEDYRALTPEEEEELVSLVYGSDEPWEGSLGETLFASGRDKYIERATELLAVLPPVPADAWESMGAILGGLGFPRDDASYQDATAAVFLCFLAESWSDVQQAQVDELIDECWE